jgi:hypothetical protein
MNVAVARAKVTLMQPKQPPQLQLLCAAAAAAAAAAIPVPHLSTS